ncbi:MAG: Lipoprotein-releasing system ATP-binding protein LolD [Candidatus Heimdallarchaeota archaeon LC_3]|nr:MAG: Lipoprotein-releasing system ATP-binding protein LolD [Candidatus Heimdallarchaeota archaeon LC_3]
MSAERDTIIEIKNLIKIYRKGHIEVTALRGINLEVKKGDMLAILGSSGSGKTTLLNVIGGISISSAGTTKVNQQEISTLSESQLAKYRRESIGFVWQIANLLPDLNIIDNVRLTMFAAGKFKRGEVNDRAKKLLDDVSIIHRAKHRIFQISGGELQRASIAIALANDPQILLADEPTGELDSETSQNIVDMLRMLNEKYGKTMLIVTHNPTVAKQCKRQLTIKDGVILKQPLKSGIEHIDIDNEGYLKIPEELMSMFANKRVRVIQTRDNEIKLTTEV